MSRTAGLRCLAFGRPQSQDERCQQPGLCVMPAAAGDEIGDAVRTLLVIHEVDDVGYWLTSPRRDELFGPLGMTARAFRDPAGSNWVALIAEVPDGPER